MGLAFPGTGRAVAGIKIIKAALQRAGQDVGAGLRLDGPPAFAGPVGPVEAAKGGAHGLCRFVADGEAGLGRPRQGKDSGPGKRQKGKDAAHAVGETLWRSLILDLIPSVLIPKFARA